MNALWVPFFGLVAFGMLFLAIRSAVRDPAFWGNMVVSIVRSMSPYFLKHNTPEIEKKMQECTRRGGTWDNFNKRCRFDK